MMCEGWNSDEYDTWNNTTTSLYNNTTLFWRVAAADLGIVLSQQNQIKRLRGAAELPSKQAANIEVKMIM